MNEPNAKQPLNQELLELIKRGEVKMRPKVYFALKATLYILAVIILSATLLYIVSFIIFSLKASGVWLLPGFGVRGFGALLMSLPWILILAVLSLIIILEVLAKHFAFVYRQPILYSLLVVMGLVLFGSFIVGQTKVHLGLYERARDNRLPFMGEMYRGLCMPEPRGWSRVTVLEIKENSFLGEKRGSKQVLVIITDETKLILPKPFAAGDILLIMGEQEGDTIKAWAIRKVHCEPDFCPDIMMRPSRQNFILFIPKPLPPHRMLID